MKVQSLSSGRVQCRETDNTNRITALKPPLVFGDCQGRKQIIFFVCLFSSFHNFVYSGSIHFSLQPLFPNKGHRGPISVVAARSYTTHLWGESMGRVFMLKQSLHDRNKVHERPMSAEELFLNL